MFGISVARGGGLETVECVFGQRAEIAGKLRGGFGGIFSELMLLLLLVLEGRIFLCTFPLFLLEAFGVRWEELLVWWEARVGLVHCG